MCETDTDSAYIAISETHLEKCVKPELREQFLEEYDKWFPARACSNHLSQFQKSIFKQDWDGHLKYDCCKKKFDYDKRTPGLFKTEFKGTQMISLNSKTYICLDQISNDVKISCKGLIKKQNTINVEDFKKVLDVKENYVGTNITFKKTNQGLVTYRESREALTYFYIKRKVLSDNITTEPLVL